MFQNLLDSFRIMANVENMPPVTDSASDKVTLKTKTTSVSSSGRKKLQTLQPSGKNQSLLVRSLNLIKSCLIVLSARSIFVLPRQMSRRPILGSRHPVSVPVPREALLPLCQHPPTCTTPRTSQDSRPMVHQLDLA